MKKNPKRRAILKPWPAAILAIDPGKTSGAAILVRGEIFGIWGVDGFEAADIVVQHWSDLATVHEAELVVVMEKWAGTFKRGSITAAGLGESAGMWKAALERNKIPKSRVVRVFPQTWYARVIGGRKRADQKDVVMRAMLHRYPQIRQMNAADKLDHNGAEALAIGTWGARAPEVGDVLPKRVREEFLARFGK